jgi:hypothetical protein
MTMRRLLAATGRLCLAAPIAAAGPFRIEDRPADNTARPTIPPGRQYRQGLQSLADRRAPPS